MRNSAPKPGKEDKDRRKEDKDGRKEDKDGRKEDKNRPDEWKNGKKEEGYRNETHALGYGKHPGQMPNHAYPPMCPPCPCMGSASPPVAGGHPYEDDGSHR